MKINTTRFGEIEIDDSGIIDFPLGLPGFQDLKKFFFLDYKDPIRWLHSADDPDIAFIVTEPFNIFHDYTFVVDDETLEFLEVKDPKDIAVFVILVVDRDVLNANLKAPLLVNLKNFKSVQYLLEDERYSFRMPVTSLSKEAQKSSQ
jgi:flagellar assembly factor FliW